MANATNITQFSNSTSLWGEVVQLPGTGFANHFAIAYLVVSFLAFFGILYALAKNGGDYNHQGDDGPLRNSAFSYLKLSMIFYLLSYSLQIADIFLHEENVFVKEGYFFTTVLRDGWWQLSDLIVLMIICRITYYQFPLWGAHAALDAIWRFMCMVFLTILTVLALYRWAVSAAYIILALNGVSYEWTVRLVLEAANLNAGYQIMYLLLSTFITVYTSYYLGRRTGFREKLDIIEGQFFAITVLFWIRSVTRADIVVKYTLHGETRPKYLDTISEALYGLPTVAIYILLNLLNKPTLRSVEKSDILRDGRRTARKELKRRRIDAANGGPALPTPAQLFMEMERKPLSYLPDQIQTKMSGMAHTEVQEILSQHIDDVLKLQKKI